MRIKYETLSGRFKEIVDAALARDGDPQPKRSGQTSPRPKRNPLATLVHIACPVRVRIIRRVPHKRRLDCDNLSGGCKQLRDAIATAMGRKGDSEEDGMFWEYEQETGCEDYETVIEVYKI